MFAVENKSSKMSRYVEHLQAPELGIHPVWWYSRLFIGMDSLSMDSLVWIPLVWIPPSIDSLRIDFAKQTLKLFLNLY